jgi:hypothetical protein
MEISGKTMDSVLLIVWLEGKGVTCLRNHLTIVVGDVVSCQNVPKFARNIMLGENARGKKNRMDAKKHHLYAEKDNYRESVWRC